MKLTPHYVPLIKSAPPKALHALGLAMIPTVVACAGTAAARVSETAPPLQGGVHCSQSVKRSYSLSSVVKRECPCRVGVTLSRVRLCGDRRHYYTRIRTRFLTHAPAAVRRQAHPPATAGCLT